MVGLVVCLNPRMASATDNWLFNLRALVDDHAQGEDKRPGYKAVASRSGLSEEYIYQLYNGVPKSDGSPRRVGPRAARALARTFANGRSVEWFDMHPSEYAIATGSAASPPAPPPDPTLGDRRAPPSESEWAILDSLRTFPQEERDRLQRDLREKADYWGRIAKELVKTHARKQ